MKAHLGGIVAAGMLVACTEVQSLRDTVATEYSISDTSVEDFATCVSGRWTKTSAQMSAVPTPG